MIKKTFMFLSLVSLSISTQAQTHSHGEGRLVLSQEENQWLAQFVLPASDIYGFEHAPETPEQELMITKRNKRLEQNDQVIHLGDQCKLNKVEFLSAHDEGEDEHHEHHDDHEHEHEIEHQDIELSYHFTCSSPVERASVQLFDWAQSLNRLEVLWLFEKGQGASEISSQKPFITW